LIVITRKERFDLYGEYASKFIPLEIIGDEVEKKSECFRLNGFSNQEYLSIITSVQKTLNYDQVELIYPKPEQFANTNQFDKTKFSYNYKPRLCNKVFVDSLNIQKPIVIIAPRFRTGVPRNWIYWKEFYNLIWELKDKFEFVICGRRPDYIPDERFLDINDFKYEGSLIGVSIELIKKSKLVVGSQSAIPSLSLLLKTPVLQWGHNRKILTTDEYNPFRIENNFVDDSKYNREASVIFDKMKRIAQNLNIG